MLILIAFSQQDYQQAYTQKGLHISELYCTELNLWGFYFLNFMVEDS